jgi:hypothetical protein
MLMLRGLIFSTLSLGCNVAGANLFAPPPQKPPKVSAENQRW